MLDFKASLNQCCNLKQLEDLRVQYLGKNGALTKKLKELGSLSPDARVTEGKKLNDMREMMLDALSEKKQALTREEIEKEIAQDRVDITLPARFSFPAGAQHPLTLTIQTIQAYFDKLGFDFVEGPDIEDEYHNFDALNTPKHHPARQSSDTFFIGSDHLLRTHTSSVQIRTMTKGAPPFRVLSCGRVYRSDSLDATHTPMFHQFEILCIDEAVTMAHLKGCLLDFVRFFFEDPTIDVRFRPSFFPFVEPGAELDIKLKGKWLEMGGCGMVHPNVLVNCGVDASKWQGFAWGCGIERFAMIKYGITDIREFYTNDMRFLRQFA